MNTTSAAPTAQPKPFTAQLRVLATTDLHGHLLPHDYIKDQPTQGGGLAGLARLIAEARAQSAKTQTPVLLFDNGDTFQGTPLATHLASMDVRADHPIVSSLNYLEYDAIGLGNHDLDHGLPYLVAIAKALDMPIVSSNLSGVDISPIQSSLLLPVDVGPQAPAPLSVGVLSMLSAQTAAWHSHHLSAATSMEEPASSITRAVEELRAAGADLVIVLAHMGVGHRESARPDIAAAHALAGAGAFDALILGHTHRRLPSVDYQGRKGMNITDSTVGGVPAIMAGHAGSDLGVMDFTLAHDQTTGWHVTAHKCVLRPNGANVVPDPHIQSLAAATHKTVTTRLSQPVASTDHALHSYFSLVKPAPTQELTARAKHKLIRAALVGTAYAQLPVLASVPAHSAGGRDGSENYIHVPEGPVLRRHIAGLNPFANQTLGVQMTGADLRNWLEHSATIFNTLDQSSARRSLVNDDVPAYQFDTIFGLNYVIDPSAPHFNRITDLHYAGVPLRPNDRFILATNQFRVAGGGGYAQVSPDRIVAHGAKPLDQSMIDTLNATEASPWGDTLPWRFAALGGQKALILTHPEALTYLNHISSLKPQLTGTTSDGFISLSITL